MAFLSLVDGQDGNLKVSVMHRCLRFIDTPGEEPSGFNDPVIGLLGDIMPHQYPAVDVPSVAFHLVGNAVRIPTVKAMEALVPAWADPQVPLGPFADGDPETEVVRPRNTQLVPGGKYAALLIHRRRVSPKVAYQEIAGAIRADGAVEACTDVLIWLRAACTARGGGGAQSQVPSVLHAFVPLHLPPEVYQYLTLKVKGDLPGLNTGETHATSAATFVGALRALTRGGEDGEIGRGSKEARTIVDAYKETHTVLLRFCNVASAPDVPNIWKRLANCHKSEQQTLLTQEMQKVCMARGLSTALYVPVVTTTLKQMVVGLQFPGNGADDLTTGCQPFLVSYAGKAHHMQVTAAAAVADQLAQGDHNATLADIRTIREGEKVKFPLNISEVCITLFRFAVLAQTLFQGTGPPHPLVEAIWGFASSLQTVGPFVTDKYNDLAGVYNLTSVYYARIVRTVQVNIYEYLSQVAVNAEDNIGGIAVPSFTSLLQELQQGTYHNSTNWIDIPSEYLQVGTTPRPVSLSVAHTTTSGRSTAPSAVSTLSTATGVSGLTEGSSSAPGTRVVNPAPDADFTSIALRPGRSRDIYREHPPPHPDNNNRAEMCVAWWTRSSCYSNCGRRATHRAFASTGERTRLLSFVREHLAAPAAGADA